MAQQTEIAVFGGGCFWCTEAVFQNLRGVISVVPGYAGGQAPNPTYDEVCSGRTGHAEVIRIEYDPEKISYKDLLTVFFATHDPTTLNRQGDDVGTQYRSVILYTSPFQEKVARQFINELNKEGRLVVTELKPLEKFYEAEEYHRNYYLKNPDKAYCQLVVNPKLEMLQKDFERLLKSSADK